jgi:signal transduction histidine kinase
MNNSEREKRTSQAAESTLNCSHGIKNLLQAISASRDLVGECLKRGDIKRAKRGWDMLDKNLIKMQKLVLDMLEYSKDADLTLTECDLNQLVEFAVDTLQPQAVEHGKTLSTDLDENLSKVICDSNRIYDIILNLVMNALEAMEELEEELGSITVTTVNNSDDQTVTVTVKDTGPGIKNIETIFKPFETSKARIGTGLGLPIVKKTVELHKGTITVQSKPGEGAAFIITLPVGVLSS